MKAVYYSNLLAVRYESVFLSIDEILYKYNIRYLEIPGTKDVWCRDYMPVTGANGKLVQFVYHPKYLRDRYYAKHITTPTCYRSLPFAAEVRESVIILDGGAIEICGQTGIVTERVFEDNYWYSRKELVQKLKESLGLSTLVVIPVEPEDITGHVDGVLRFVDEGCVIMNDYSSLRDDVRLYGQVVEERLKAHDILDISLMPYSPTFRNGPDGFPDAVGCYINFLKVENLLVLPQFGIPADAAAIARCEEVFSGYAIETIDCSELARAGGVLNCISWSHKTN